MVDQRKTQELRSENHERRLLSELILILVEREMDSEIITEKPITDSSKLSKWEDNLAR